MQFFDSLRQFPDIVESSIARNVQTTLKEYANYYCRLKSNYAYYFY